MNEDFLEHFGVKGMKWGVKRNKDRVETAKSSDHTETRAIMQKPVSAMSNSELQRVNTRRQLETQYSQLNPISVSRGKQTVTNVLSYGKTINDIYSTINGPIAKDIRKMLKDK